MRNYTVGFHTTLYYLNIQHLLSTSTHLHAQGNGYETISISLIYNTEKKRKTAHILIRKGSGKMNFGHV